MQISFRAFVCAFNLWAMKKQVKTKAISPQDKMKPKKLSICLISGIHDFVLPRVIDVADMVKRIKPSGNTMFALTINEKIITIANDPCMLGIAIMHHPTRNYYWVGEFESIDDYMQWAADFEEETTGTVTKQVALQYRSISEN
jgi:hypothetical protein